MKAPLIHPFVAAFEDLIHHLLKPLRIQQAPLQVPDNGFVEPIHRNRDAGAALRALPRLRGAGVIAILAADAASAGAQRHGSAAARAEADAGRSEEHTSELQSLMRISYAVFCLKKKKYHTTMLSRLSYNFPYSTPPPSL